MLIRENDLDDLTRDSHLDASGVKYFSSNEVEEAVFAEPERKRGSLPNVLWTKLRLIVEASPDMPRGQKRQLLERFDKEPA